MEGPNLRDQRSPSLEAGCRGRGILVVMGDRVIGFLLFQTGTEEVRWNWLRGQIRRHLGGEIRFRRRRPDGGLPFAVADSRAVELGRLAGTAVLDELGRDAGAGALLELWVDGECAFERLPEVKLRRRVPERVSETAFKAVSRQADVLVVTATRVERRALLARMRPLSGQSRVLEGPLGHSTARVGQLGRYFITHVETAMGSGGPRGATLAASRAIQLLRPRAILVLGIAFGARPGEQRLGDVLIAEAIVPYEVAKQRAAGPERRGLAIPSGQILFERFRGYAEGWTLHRRRDRVAFFTGLVLSGEKVIAASDFRDMLREDFPTAIGGEMEGSGVYAAALSDGPEALLVKAVCDWGDGSKNDSAQPFAAHAAVSLAEHVLSQPDALAGLARDRGDPRPVKRSHRRSAGSPATGGGGEASSVPPEPLPSHSRHPAYIHHLIEHHTALFVGRSGELNRIERFVREASRGYVFVEGLSGYGKTSLLAALARQRPEFAYHFSSSVYGSGAGGADALSLASMAANLKRQLVTSDAEEEPAAEQLRRLLVEAPTAGHRVIVLDAVDELSPGGALHGVLPPRLADGVFVIFSARTLGDRQSALNGLGLTHGAVDLHVELPGLDAAAIVDLLVAGGTEAARHAGNRDFVETIESVSRGDPFYLRFLVEDIAAGDITPTTVGKAPRGLWPYLDQQFAALGASTHSEQQRFILGCILQAEGPLARGDLIALTQRQVGGVDWLNFGAVVGDIRRFLLVYEDRFTFCHPRFKEYFATRVVGEPPPD